MSHCLRPCTEKKETHSFDVTRWENMSPQQKRSAQPFSLGSRNCIGQYLARIESRLAAALFFRELKGAKMSKEMIDSMMEFKVRFLAAPSGEKCEITLLENEAQ
jgi:cytochrome P450